MGRKKRAREPKDWSVYVLRCAGGALYTGIAKDVLERLRKHQAGRGAAYTRSHLPVELVYREDLMTRTEALIREAGIKRLPKPKKEALISGGRRRPNAACAS
jgi:putative endonuclease